MVPIGTHKARAIDCALGMTGTGKEQIGVLLELSETAERITWYGYFTDGTFERTIESLRYLGWSGTDLLAFRSGLPSECVNEVEIVVEDEADQDGKLRRKVRWINGSGGVAIKETLDDGQARVFAAKMRAKVAALQAKTGVAAPRSSTPKLPSQVATNASGEVLAEDEIPF